MANEVRLIEITEKQLLAIKAVSYGCANNKRLYGASYMTGWSTENPQEIPFVEAWQIVQEFVEELPTVDPESLRPKGHWNIRCHSTYDSWTQETDEEFYLECSECKREVWNIDQSAALGGEYRKLVERFPYCHCGCKMEG